MIKYTKLFTENWVREHKTEEAKLPDESGSDEESDEEELP